MPSQQQRDEGDTGAARRGPNPLVCEMFQGINTATTRAGVPDQQMYWCDGFLPLAPRNLRVLPDIGSAIYNGPADGVVCFYSFNIGPAPYLAVFRTDGEVDAVRTDTGAVTVVLPTGSIANVSITQLGIAQYGSQYLIIVANQANGYWLWDGNLTYGSGTLAPGVTITNPGAAYVSPPAVIFSGGSGSGAAATATVADGVVTNISITNPGSGYEAGDLPTITLVGGTQTGTGAALTAVLTHEAGGSGASLTPVFTFIGTEGSGSGAINLYRVSSISIPNGGSGYSNLTQAAFVLPSSRGVGDNMFTGPGIPAVIQLTISSGVIVGASVVNTSNIAWNTFHSSPQFPTISVTDPGAGYTVTSVTGTPTGSGYSPSAVIVASGGGAPVTTQATITPIITGGVITGVNILDGGLYGSNTPPTLAVTDVAVPATATVQLMPCGVQGTCVETYAGHVWVANGALVQFTAPGSVSDFSTANGGASFRSSDSFLRVGYTRLIQTNGFLFLIGDSSMNYISNVQTDSTPTTTFTNNNCDPETGTPYPATVTTIGQDIFIANQNGIYVSSGGTFEKKSEALDGVYNSAPDIFNGRQLSAAKDLIFGKLVWFVLVPIIDPITKVLNNKMFMFNEKYWWSSDQSVAFTFIGSQEINSVFQSYGTDGTNIYPLFTTPSAAFTKTMQTRVWDAPAGYDHTKSSVNLFAIAQFLGASSLEYFVYIDNEAGPSGRGGPYTHSGPTAGADVFNVMPPTAIGQVGVLTGMTVLTNADDLAIVSIMMQDEVVQYRA